MLFREHGFEPGFCAACSALYTGVGYSSVLPVVSASFGVGLRCVQAPRELPTDSWFVDGGCMAHACAALPWLADVFICAAAASSVVGCAMC